MKFPLLHLIPLAAALLVAVVWDLGWRKIPNAVCGAIAAIGAGVQLWDGGVLAALGALGAGVSTMFLLFVFWTRGGIGGGDVKLAGAVAIWVGIAGLPAFWLSAALAGGLVAAVCLLASRASVRREIAQNLTLAALQQTMPDLGPVTPGRISVPYAVAIAVGAAVVWWRAR